MFTNIRFRKQQAQQDKLPGVRKKSPKNKDRDRRGRTLELVHSNNQITPSTIQGDSMDPFDNPTPSFPYDVSASASPPLQEFPPEVNLPRRPSTTSLNSASSSTTADSVSKITPASDTTAKQPTPNSAIPPEPPEP